MKLTNKSIWAIVILVVMNNALALDVSDAGSDEIFWLSSSTNTLLTRSSTALATQHYNRGIRLAQRALQTELNVTDQLIANHNLCIGYLSTGNDESGKSYCEQTKELAQLSFNLIRVRGAYYLADQNLHSYSRETLSLSNVVLRNIEIIDTTLQLFFAAK